MALTNIVNDILRLYYCPGKWKSAAAIMLPKHGKSGKFSQNYRLISLFPVMSKIVEKIVIIKLTSSNQLSLI